VCPRFLPCRAGKGHTDFPEAAKAYHLNNLGNASRPRPPLSPPQLWGARVVGEHMRGNIPPKVGGLGPNLQVRP